MLAWDVCPGEETIAAYAAGQLPRDEREAVDSHLDTCSACQELVAALAKVSPPREQLAVEPAFSGDRLGRYVLLSRLGAGGMGVVYAAYDPELDRRVALKVLRTRAGAQLREEARAIAKLQHPNVIAVHDVGEADGEVFVAMEHVDGMTVREWLRERRTHAEILDVFTQAGRGLAAAHRVGLVHRDVKPSNIMVGKDGRARVLDFGLALARADGERGTVAGTPAYMAPEQKRGEIVDAHADQYAFAVALWEALGGARDGDAIDGVPDRVVRALRRARRESPGQRFDSIDDLLDELAPPSRTRRWVIATALALAALVGTLAFTVTREQATPSCAKAGAPATAVWSTAQRSAVRSSFAATKLPFAAKAADATIAELDAWTARWRERAEQTCRATVIDRVQPAELHALRTSCLEQLLERLRPIVALAEHADARVVANALTLASSLPSPERCDDATALAAVAPPAERDRAAVDQLRAEVATHETALLAGRARDRRDEILALAKRAGAIEYLPLRARIELLVARLQSASAQYGEAITGLHAAARSATAARDLALLAEIWIELAQTLGNDVRTLDQAALFDGYAAALIPQLPARAQLELGLHFARCNRQATGAEQAKQVATSCEQAIAHAGKLTPPRPAIAIAARTRLGHFLRLQGKQAESVAMLRENVNEAGAFHGPQHPDVAIAHFALGLALISEDKLDDGIAALRTALDIRRAAFPPPSVQVAESLQGLGDALASAGKHDEAIPLFEEALQIISAAGETEGIHAVQVHMLLGMSLQELKRSPEALPHYVVAADIADRKLQGREALAAMALRLAASVENDRGRIPEGVPHLERAVRLLERAKAAPAELGRTQFALAQFLFELGPQERARARATAEAARASFVAAGATQQIAETDALLRAKR